MTLRYPPRSIARAAVRRALTTVAVTMLAGCGGDAPDAVELAVVPSAAMANRILYELSVGNVDGAQRESITVDRKPAHRITVPTAQLTLARAVLVKRNLPRDELGGFEQMLGSAGMIPTATDERARLMFALSQELSRTIESIDGVNLARVHVYLPEANPLALAGAALPSPNVAVLIKHDERLVEATTRQQVAQIVQGAVPDVADQAVRVVLIPSEKIDLPADSTAKPASTRAAGWASTREKIELVVILILTIAVLVLGHRVVRAPRPGGRVVAGR